MHLTNTETVPGMRIVAFKGIVSGSTVRAKHAGRDLMAGLKNIFGGELKGYTELLEDSRKQALERMRDHARHLDANAIVNVRFSTSSVAAGAAEIYVYGTAVNVEPLDQSADNLAAEDLDVAPSDDIPAPTATPDEEFAPPHMRERSVEDLDV